MSVTNLVLIGRTGNGKSATGNTILRRREFVSRMSQKSVTKQCESGSREWSDGRTIRVIDTPGLFDTDAKRGVVEKELVRCIDIAKDGIHAFILVLSMRSRFTEEEVNAFRKVEVLFGPDILNYVTIVFTGADLLNADGYFSLEDYLKDTSVNLKQLLRKLDRRVVEFDNVTTDEAKKRVQVSKLMEIVDRTVADNEGPYTNELFEKAKRLASEMHFVDKEQYYQDQIKELNEMMLRNTQEAKAMMLAEIQRIKKEAESATGAVIRELTEQLEEYRKNLANIKEIEEGKCCKGCSIM